MKVEIRCPACGRGYLVEESKIPSTGGKFACKNCGLGIEVAQPHGSRARPSPARPAEPVPPPPAPASEDTAPAAACTPAEVVCPRCGLWFLPVTDAAAARSSTRPTILVVEDLEYFIEIATDALSPKYEVKTARSLREARAALSSGRIDAILLDLKLEGGEDGLALLREMPAKPCPVLIFTAEDEIEMYGETWENLRALGADDLVVKGLQAGELLARKIGILLGEPEEPIVR